MVSSVQNTNIQRFSAVNALKTSANFNKQNVEEKDKNFVDNSEINGTKAAPKSLLERVDVSDIRKCAEYVGEYNITDEDIKYGLMYGRSVIAEYLC
ncbi:hypothetical protein IJO12_06005 [bacterium]|nr:hypothetical protein [bacterium]